MESRASTRLGENVRLLTFVGIFFLPLSFTMTQRGEGLTEPAFADDQNVTPSSWRIPHYPAISEEEGGTDGGECLNWSRLTCGSIKVMGIIEVS
ncbi:hypothetical protein BofuT4_uP070790.1 [Botrytis cinerea T4]|uniref:Uncharacterized protein n=1 Tax=Botryotinia fuckeliana (strain T4) TaxID=999810 RepID=G2XQB5_BOTF4|nr:hypothetical protein BofuT4_uP070790.1 [Botrytis cinerea T4]